MLKDIEELREFGFGLIKQWDEEENEEYFDLLLEEDKVGFTEINEKDNSIEIICEDRESYLKVKRIVKDEIIVWAWYESAMGNFTSYKDNKLKSGRS